jgi:DNA-binding PadR family transcriptional regulator
MMILIKHKKRYRLSTLRYDTSLLERLKQETCVYDLVREGFARSSAYKILKEYERRGIVNVRVEKTKVGFKIKRYYKLNDLGLSLLEIVRRMNEE